jgi:type II secretory pathway component GspD/PulD (secretin)
MRAQTRSTRVPLALVLLFAFATPLLAEPEAVPWEKAIETGLAKKISFDFAEAPLPEAVAFLRQFAGMNLVLDPSLRERNVTLRMRNAPLEDGLKWTCKLAGARYDLLDGAVYIHKGQFPRPAPDPKAVERVTASLRKKKITFNFRQAPLREVKGFLEAFAGINIILGPAQKGLEDRPVTAVVKDVPMDEALDAVCTAAKARYTVRGRAIVLLDAQAKDPPKPKPWAPRAVADAASRKRAAERLAEPISFNFREIPVAEAFRWLAMVTKADLVVDPEVGKRRLTMQAKDMQTCHALAWFCRLRGGRYEFKGNVILIRDAKATAP